MLFHGLETKADVEDLGDVDPAWAGISSPRYSDSTVARYLQGQFLEDAGAYLERYQATDYWKALLTRAQRHFALEDRGRPLRILDLGSGGGNTVLPLLDLYPGAEVVASDLSLPLLKALRAALDQRHPTRRVAVLQQNAEQLIFADRQFDLVVGGAILHHLRSPGRAIAECSRVLGPRGVAVFFEPFLAGNRIVAAVFRSLLDLNEGRAPRPSRALPDEVRVFLGGLRPLPPGAPRLSPELARALVGVCWDISVRARMSWAMVRLRRLDDKWLFQRRFFTREARKGGFCEPRIFGLGEGPKRFAEHLHAVVRLVLGSGASALPPWATAVVDGLDDRLAPETRSEALIEAGIVLQKA